MFVSKHFYKTGLLVILLMLMLSINVQTELAAQTPPVEWTEATQIPSPDETSSWFPDLAVDRKGRVHVVWNETIHQIERISEERLRQLQTEDSVKVESVYYTVLDGQQWLPFTDIIAPEVDIIRNSITIDETDALHLTYGWFTLNHKTAPANQALSAVNWSDSRIINTRGGTYLNDSGTYSGSLYVVYDDAGYRGESNPCSPGVCADIYFRHSPDGGRTWLEPVSLFPTDVGSGRAQLAIDKAGILHVAWDEGWDRFTEATSRERYGVYTFSDDSGKTWSNPTLVTHPNASNTQLTVGSDGEGGVMLVWRTLSKQYPGIYYMWSTDGGSTWTPPKTIPGLLSRSDIGDARFDKYDMGTDSGGNIHLLVVGRKDTEPDRRPGLYHLQWNGSQWSTPEAIYEGTWYPEYPQLVVHQGNQLHAAWFIRQDPFDLTEPYQVWYAQGQTNTLTEIPPPLPTATVTPTSTPVPPTPTPILIATPTPTLALDIADIKVPEGAIASIYTEYDELQLILQSLLPAMLVIAVVGVIVYFIRRS